MRFVQDVAGIVVPLLLPLDDKERVIQHDLAEHVRRLLKCGVNGFLVPSGTGEFYNLTFEERRRAVEIVVAEVAGKVPVISLVSECGTQNTLRVIEAARQAGANGAMAAPPFFTPLDQAGLKIFFNDLANDGGLPLWLYHQPAHTKLNIDPDTVVDLAQNPNIKGIKASAWVDMLYYERLLRVLRSQPQFRILMGEDNHLLSGLILGGHGAVSTLANLLPDETVGLWKAVQCGDLQTARGLQNRIHDVQEAVLFAFPNWQWACKRILCRRGVFSSDFCSRPYTPFSEQHAQELDEVTARLKL